MAVPGASRTAEDVRTWEVHYVAHARTSQAGRPDMVRIWLTIACGRTMAASRSRASHDRTAPTRSFTPGQHAPEPRRAESV